MRLLLFTFLWSTWICIQMSAQCPTTAEFTTQAQIDNFATDYPDCFVIEGDMYIDGYDSNNPNNITISNLTGLSQLTKVGGNLSILRTGVTSLLGLENLELVEGENIYIGSNDDLNQLSALQNTQWRDTIQNLTITYNPNLQTLQGLNQVIHLDKLILEENFILNSLSGLESLVSLRFWEMEYNNVQNFSPLTSLQDLSELVIENEDNIILIGLENITSLERLRLRWCPNLENLQGLNNLDSVYASINIEQCNDLENLSGLENLRTLGSFGLINCSSFNSLEALSNLETVRGGGVSIRSLPELASLAGLENLQTIDDASDGVGGMSIVNNDALVNLSGLNNLTSMSGSLRLDGNAILQNLVGLESLEYIGSDLRIEDCHELQSLEGLSALERVDREIKIWHNDGLQSVAGMTAMTNTNSIWLMDNSSLETLEGFEGITSIDSSLQVGNNEHLYSIEGLNNIESSGNFVIGGSPELTSFAGAEKLKNLSGSLVLVRLGILNMTGLDSLEYIASKVWIRDNPNLVSLEGFGAPTGIYADTLVEITGNDNLTLCAVETVCNRIESNYPILIEDNAVGCNSVQEVQEQCDSLANVSSVNEPYESISLRPNPASEQLLFMSEEAPSNWSIVDISGRIVYNGKTTLGENKLEIMHLPQGIYFLRVFGDKNYAQRFIISRN